MTDIEHVAERLRQIAESQRMDFDGPNVAMTLDESANALDSVIAERDALRAIIDEAVRELDRIEDRVPHDIDGMVYTIPWAEGVVSGSKRVRRILSRATTEEGAD